MQYYITLHFFGAQCRPRRQTANHHHRDPSSVVTAGAPVLVPAGGCGWRSSVLLPLSSSSARWRHGRVKSDPVRTMALCVKRPLRERVSQRPFQHNAYHIMRTVSVVNKRRYPVTRRIRQKRKYAEIIMLMAVRTRALCVNRARRLTIFAAPDST